MEHSGGKTLARQTGVEPRTAEGKPRARHSARPLGQRQGTAQARQFMRTVGRGRGKVHALTLEQNRNKGESQIPPSPTQWERVPEGRVRAASAASGDAATPGAPRGALIRCFAP